MQAPAKIEVFVDSKLGIQRRNFREITDAAFGLARIGE